MQFISSSASMVSTTAYSPVKNSMKVGSDLVGGPHRQMVSGRRADSANASNHPEFNDYECLPDDCPLTPMPSAQRSKIVPTETPGSVCSIPSLSLTTGSSCLGDREVMQKIKHMESDTASILEGTICHREKAMELNHLHNRQPERQYIHKENLLSLNLANPERGKQSLQNSVSIYACNGLGTLGTEDKPISEGPNMQHQNVYQLVSSQPHISLDSRAMNMAGNLESSRNMPERLKSAQCARLYMGAGEERICRDMLQDKETAGSAGITPRSAKGGSVVSQQPVTHAVSVMKCEDSCGWKFKIPSLTNTQSAGTNNFSVKGLKYIPILTTPMGANFDWSDSNKGNLCLSNGNSSILEKKKRKSVCVQKQRETYSTRGLADENRYFLKATCQPEGADNYRREGERHCQQERQHGPIKSPNHYSPSKYCFKKHKVFADKVQVVLPGSKTLNGIIEPQNRNMRKVGSLLPQSQALVLNGNGVKPSSVNLMQLHSLGDLGLSSITATSSLEGTSTKPLSNPADIRNTMKKQSLHDGSFQAMGLRLGGFEYAPGPAASEKKTPRRISPSESDWGKFLALSAASEIPQVEHLEKETPAPYQHRFRRLQAFLRQCDESDQYYLQALWPLSAAARNERAVKLERRAILLSLEEDIELQRMKMLDVFGKNTRGGSKGMRVLQQC